MAPDTNTTHAAIAPITAANPAYLVEVDGRSYQIIPVNPSTQPPPVPIHPAPIIHSAYQNPNHLIGLGIGLIVASAGLTWLIMRAFAPPIPAAGNPSTVIVQPPTPQPQPYSIRSCTPSGLFGLNQACTEERGMR